MEIETVLVTVDGSEESLGAVEYTIGVAERYRSHVHALYVLDEEVIDALADGDEDSAAIADEMEAFFDEARELVGDRPFSYSTAYGYSRSQLSRHPGSVILDTAASVGADFLVVPREPVSGEPGKVLGKAAQYVLAYAPQPVLSV
ncbi:MAG: universal stress protein [Haloarculaceae archaeon]